METINKILLILLLVGTVNAEDIYREFTTTTNNEVYLANFPYWCEVGEGCTVYVTNPDEAITNNATITINGSTGDMNYDESNNVFYATIISGTEENANFSINISDNANNTLAIANDTLRFRIPFTTTLKFYQNQNASDTSTKPYDNEFQYAMMYYRPTSGSTYSYELKSGTGNINGFLNAVGSIFPYYKKVGTTKPKITQDIFLYAKMSSGEAEIKTYENGTYDLFTVNAPITSTFFSYYEFGRPIANDATERRTAVAGEFKIQNETAPTYSVFISAWEVYKWHTTMNLVKIIAILLLYGAIIIGLSFLLTFWIPNPEMAAQAFKTMMIVFGISMSPLLIIAYKVLM